MADATNQILRTFERAQVQRAIVSFYVPGQNSPIGSGFIHSVEQGNLVLVTASHVVLRGGATGPPPHAAYDGLQVFVRDAVLIQANPSKRSDRQDVQEPVALVGISANDDVAVLVTVSGHFDARNTIHLCFASQPCRVGEAAVIIGTPLGLLDVSASFGIIRDCSVLPNTDDPDWTMAVPNIMVSAPVSNGSSGSAILNKTGRVIGLAQWRLSTATTFAGGVAGPFLERIINIILNANRFQVSQPYVGMLGKNFDASTGKGSLGITQSFPLVGGTLMRMQASYPAFAQSEHNRPRGIVNLDFVPVQEDNGKPAGALAAGMHPDDVSLSYDGVGITVGDDQTDYIRKVYFREKDVIPAVVLNPTTVVQKNLDLRVGRFPTERERLGTSDEFDLIAFANLKFAFQNRIPAKPDLAELVETVKRDLKKVLKDKFDQMVDGINLREKAGRLLLIVGVTALGIALIPVFATIVIAAAFGLGIYLIATS